LRVSLRRIVGTRRHYFDRQPAVPPGGGLSGGPEYTL
jgi:hypothetical protein